MNPIFSGQGPTLDQRRARHAWDAVRHAKQSKDQGKVFKGQAKKLPTRIKASGIGHALAFLHAKKYAPELLEAVGDWVLNKRRDAAHGGAAPAADALLREIVHNGADFLRNATEETLAYLQWLIRFADAEIEADEA